ncbi:protein phosphatase 2C [Bacillus mycoides]|uniref:protein phosphatase 2C n=1 Tax=Bacillus mycoides TaxID=1405 RepID=UPI001C00DE9C|nr:protein phosphatase 2C [Bacillus mycoides]QWG52454.1 protein phosphatase 2C [Bacillus mycoides]QWH36257.1 protein phosphatase 2C [Bacillus mycoides]
MLKKIKKFMIVAAAAVMLSAGFATVAPNEAHAAHWADKQMNWAFSNRIITADLRDSYATRQDAWLMITRATRPLFLGGFEDARKSVVERGISDGTRGTNWVTRNEMAAMIFNYTALDSNGWTPQGGFEEAIKWGRIYGYFDGTRGNDAATRAEVVTMLYNKFRNNR